MRFLLTTTGLGALATVLAVSPAMAGTTISTAVTTPQKTSATGDLDVATAGSVKVTSGAAITIDSANTVKNEGTIGITGANNSTGILADAGLTSAITNTGTITIDENYTPTDNDNDGDLDGPFAQGSNRFGIHVLGGGTFTGDLVNNGSISVEGNQSGAIAVDGALNGSLKITGGKISVLGDNSVGIKTGAVTGNVQLINGAIQVQGANDVGVAITGDVGGMIDIQNTVNSTGYRSTVAPADPSKLDADDLLQGGSAVVISGNVAHGIIFDAQPADTSTSNTDEDNDGIPDANEGTASIASFGAAPAVVIGSATADTSIGALASSTNGLVVKGSVGGFGVYSGVSATGMQIGGLGHTVDIAGGMSVVGTIGASSADSNATALHLGAGAIVPTLTVSGELNASGGNASTSAVQALLIDQGASISTIKNSGVITASRAGTAGTVSGIVDKSGLVTSIQNTGSIGIINADTLGNDAVAIDLSANTSGATIEQLAVAADATAPTITGNILLGSGNDVLDVADGTVAGAARFGAGNNQLRLSGDAAMTSAVQFGSGVNSVQLNGSSVLSGSIDFGGGADSLSLAGTSAFHGTLANSSSSAVNVGAGSTFDITAPGSVNLASLATGAGSTLGVSLGQAGTSTLFNVSGAADFGANTGVKVNLLSLGGVAGTYKIIQAGTLTGADNLTADSSSVPFLYSANLLTDTPGQVSLQVSLKSAQQLGLNSSEADILNAVVGSADSDSPVAQVFLGANDSSTLRASLQQMLPENASGVFENATKGSRLTSEILADPSASVLEQQGFGIWAQQVAWGSSKSIGDTSSYHLSAWGAAAGLEHSVGFGSIGLMGAYYSSKDKRNSNELIDSELEGGIYWRANIGHVHAFARGTIGHLSFDGSRYFNGTADGVDVTRTADGKWNGTLTSASGGLSYELRSGRLSVRPNALLEYYHVTEDGYSETGGGSAFDLIVDRRNSSESAASAGVALGYDFLSTDHQNSWMRVEVEGGRRQILSGKLGDTTAHFAGGDDFTIASDSRTNGWHAALRLTGGGAGVTVLGEVNGEQQQGHASIGARLGLQLAL
jgi:hypothetical protein